MSKLASSHKTALLSWTHAKVSGCADLNTLKRVDWSDSIEFLRCRHEKTPVKFRDPKISEVLGELQAARPSVQAFIEFMVTIYRLGLAGVECSQDLLCEHIRRISHASRFGARTLRAAVRWSVSHGYVDQSWLPIGKRVLLASGDYRTMKIRRYESTHKIRLLCSVLRADPDKLRAAAAQSGVKNLHFLTVEKRSDNPKGEQQESIRSEAMLSCMLLRQDETKDDRQETRGERTASQEVKESETSSDTGAAFNGKGRSANRSDNADRPLAARRVERPKVKADRISTRRSVLTYQKARRNFLHELFVALKPGSQFAAPTAADLWRIASVQTEVFYSADLPAALDWFDFLIETFFKDWGDRRRDIDRIVLPALRRFLAAWTMPDIDPAAAGAARRFADWERSIMPDLPVWFDPAAAALFMHRWGFARSALSGLFAGRFDWADQTMTGGGPLARFCDLYCGKSTDNV